MTFRKIFLIKNGRLWSLYQPYLSKGGGGWGGGGDGGGELEVKTTIASVYGC